MNGLGSDALVLVCDAREKKVVSINGEPRAPRVATIEWFRQNNHGELPTDGGLLAGGIPYVVDAWTILLARWGEILRDVNND